VSSSRSLVISTKGFHLSNTIITKLKSEFHSEYNSEEKDILYTFHGFLLLPILLISFLGGGLRYVYLGASRGSRSILCFMSPVNISVEALVMSAALSCTNQVMGHQIGVVCH